MTPQFPMFWRLSTAKNTLHVTYRRKARVFGNNRPNRDCQPPFQRLTRTLNTTENPSRQATRPLEPACSSTFLISGPDVTQMSRERSNLRNTHASYGLQLSGWTWRIRRAHEMPLRGPEASPNAIGTQIGQITHGMPGTPYAASWGL